MSLVTEQTPLPGVVLIKPKKFGDDRGYFLETFRESTYRTLGLELPFVQDNSSLSSKGVLRGLHLQWPNPQAKLVSVAYGAIFDVAVDVRRGSPTFGKSYGVELSAQNGWQLYIPKGFAHGFCALDERNVICYKCSNYYSPETERTILWNDDDLGIAWPVSNPLISPKDQQGLRLRDIPSDLLPPYVSGKV